MKIEPILSYLGCPKLVRLVIGGYYRAGGAGNEGKRGL